MIDGLAGRFPSLAAPTRARRRRVLASEAAALDAHALVARALALRAAIADERGDGSGSEAQPAA